MIKCHTTNTYPCSYLPEQSARSEVVLPECPVDTQVYGELIQAGFRRSGNYVYRPSCAHCQACVPARVNVNTFVPNRTQRRTWKQHQTLIARQHTLHYKQEHYALYQRYLAERHSGGGMDYDSREQYGNFLLQSNVNSRLVEFYEMERLRMVSIIDILPDGLSSVYAFFDPAVTNASYGTYNILWQIHQCRELGLTYLYLGYWIRENRKMRYKANFQPLEILREGCWQRYNNGDTA